MSDMFLGCEKFNQPIGHWDTSNVTAMISMFKGAKSFNQPIGDWDTSKVYNISRIFEGAESFNQNINNWDTSEMNLMTAAFKDAHSFNQPLNKWKINSSCQLFSMFENAKSFNQDISNFKVSGSISSFLAGAESFNSPLNWDVSKVKSMKSLFHGAKSFNQDISDWDVSKVTNTENMFYGALSFNMPIGNWKLSSLTNMNNMFREAKSFNQDVSQWDVSKVTKMKGLFQDAVSFNQNIKNWKLNEQIKKSRTIFQGASAFDFDKYNPFLNENINEKVVTRKRNIDTSTDNLSTEEKKKFTKIKNLLISRDISKINMGIEILVSLNNIEIYSSLLKDCKFIVNEGGKIELSLNKLFSGSREAQPFLNYSLFSIISIVPNDKNLQIDNSLKIENIKVLDLSSIDFPELEDVIVMPDLSRFKNLDKLIISFYRKIQTSIKNNSITHLILNHFQGSLKFLSDLPQLEYLELDIDSYEKSIRDLDSFNSLTEF
jgi:surface protein